MWEDFWGRQLPAWRRLIALARRRVLQGPSRAGAVMAQFPLLSPCGPELDGEEEQDEFLSGACELSFPIRAGARVHRALVHGSGANTAVKAYVGSSRCPACQRALRMRMCAVQHLRPRPDDTNRCREFVLGGHVPRLSAEAAAAADASDRAHQQACRRRGVNPLAADGLFMKFFGVDLH